MSQDLRTALAAFRADPTDALAANIVVLKYQTGVSMRMRLDDVDRATLEAMEEVPLLIRARMAVVAIEFMDGEREEAEALAEIRGLQRKWRTLQE